MKFGIVPKGPADKLTKKAKALNPSTPILIVDKSTCFDSELFAVFVFTKYRTDADAFNSKREKAGLRPFAIVDVPFGEKEIKVLPADSVRGRIVQILKEGPAYGYEIYKKYKKRYGNISMRLIYYHISRGQKDNLFEIDTVKQSEGNFSWGGKATRKYYKLKSSAGYK